MIEDDLDVTRANAELSSLTADLRENFPQDYQVSGLELELLPLGSSTVPHVRPALLSLLGTVGLPLGNDPQRLPFSPRSSGEVGDVDR